MHGCLLVNAGEPGLRLLLGLEGLLLVLLSLLGLHGLVDQLELARVERSCAPELLNQLELVEVRSSRLAWLLIRLCSAILSTNWSLHHKILRIGVLHELVQRLILLNALSSCGRKRCDRAAWSQVNPTKDVVDLYLLGGYHVL